MLWPSRPSWPGLTHPKESMNPIHAPWQERCAALLSLICILCFLPSCDAGPGVDPSAELERGGQPSAAGDFVVGFLGCSMTRDKGTGLDMYTSVEGWKKFAPDGSKVMTQYSGGTIDRWGKPGENGYNNKWSAFKKGLVAWPATNIIIWEICIRAEEVTANTSDYLDEVQHIAGRIASEAPGVPVYVTGMVEYDPGMVCSITGPDGVEFAAQVADLAVANTSALPASGLQLGPLSPLQVIRDGCHANASGMEEQALQIASWLNNL